MSSVLIHRDDENDDGELKHQDVADNQKPPQQQHEQQQLQQQDLPHASTKPSTLSCVPIDSKAHEIVVSDYQQVSTSSVDYMTHPRVMMGWSNLSISCPATLRTIVANCSAYVMRGGVLAVLGPSPSGKSLLLKTLSGRQPNLLLDGQVTLRGHQADVLRSHSHVAFVPAEDILIGELTVRETFTTAALLSTNDSEEVVAIKVQNLIDTLGLQAVQDNAIGTVLKRGLSGGEKRRVSVGVGLMAAPSVIFLDEPTSGLDSTAAYQVIRGIRELAQKSEGRLAVVLTIHQPNSRILSLFDHMLVLPSEDKAETVECVFGTVPYVVSKFPDWGLPAPDDDPSLTLESVAGVSLSDKSGGDSTIIDDEDGDTWYWRQFRVLTQRNVRVATRDITLYYLQFLMMAFYGFVIGAFFYDLPRRIDMRISDISNGIVWLALPGSYINVFKVYYLMTCKERYIHERANNSYAVAPYWFAELLVSSIASFFAFIPGLLIAYSMMGLPSDSIGFYILVLYFCVLISEAVCQSTVQFTKNSSYAMVAAQGLFVVLCVFAGGSFIRWEYVPKGWVWVSEVSFYTPVTRSVMIDVFSRISYTCQAAFVSAGLCTHTGLGFTAPCASVAGDGSCVVDGSQVLLGRLGVSSSDDKWFDFGVLVILVAITKLCIFILHWISWDEIVSALNKAKGGATAKAIIRNFIRLQYVSTRMTKFNDESKELGDGITEQTALLKKEESSFAIPSGGMGDAPMVAHLTNFVHNIRETKKVIWKGLTLKLPGSGKILVDNLRGFATAGRVLAIMGPSGAGKTTMLNALTGRAPYAKVTGQVLYCNRVLNVSDLAFVPQFDTLNNRLSVHDTLRRMAELKHVYNRKSGADHHVARLLNILGLEGKARETIGSLTSGERKRVSIGVGMIASPNVLCLDEPTTGLDAEAAFNVVSYIRRIAREMNIVVFMTIHQPSGVVFDMLDDLLLMCRTPTVAGQCAYFGPSGAAKEYFGALGYRCPTCLNLSDFYLDLVSRSPSTAAVSLCKGLGRLEGGSTSKCLLNIESEKGVSDVEASGENDDDLTQASGTGRKMRWLLSATEHESCITKLGTLAKQGDTVTWNTLYLNSAFSSSLVSDNILRPIPEFADGQVIVKDEPSSADKYFALVRQQLFYYLLEPGMYTVRLGQLILIGLFIGSMYYNLEHSMRSIPEIAGGTFFATWCTLFSVVAAVPIWVRDRPGFQNDVLNGAYTLNQYAASIFSSSIPYTLVTAIAFQSIVHWMTDFNSSAESFIFNILMTFATLLMMESVTLCIVEALRSFDAMLSTTMSMIALGMMFLCPGFFIKTDDMPPSVRWLSYIIPTRYVLRGQLISVFSGQNYSSPMGTIQGDALLKGNFNVDADEASMWVWWFVVIVYVFGFRILHRLIMTYTFSPLLKSSFPTSLEAEKSYEKSSGASVEMSNISQRDTSVDTVSSSPASDTSPVRITVLPLEEA